MLKGSVGAVAISVEVIVSLFIALYLGIQAPPSEVPRPEPLPRKVILVPVYETRARVEENQWYPEPKTIEETFPEDNYVTRVRIENALGYLRIMLIKEIPIGFEIYQMPEKYHSQKGSIVSFSKTLIDRN